MIVAPDTAILPVFIELIWAIRRGGQFRVGLKFLAS
jgi:hypothetical protein